jgi:hypothetical protein
VNTAVLTSVLVGLLSKIISFHGYEQDNVVGLLTLMVRAIRCFETSGSIYQLTWRNISDDLNVLQRRC